jgi:hypothetical protein
MSLASFFTGLLAEYRRATGKPEFAVAPDGRSVIALVREGYTVQKWEAGNRPVRNHTFVDVESVAAFITRHAHPATTDIGVEGSLTRFIVHADEPNASYQVSLNVPLHPRFERWNNVFGKELTTDQLFRLFVSGSDDFDPVVTKAGDVIGNQGRELAGQLRQLRVSRDATVQVDLDENGNYRGASASDRHAVSAKLPSEFDVIVPWFRGVHAGRDAEGVAIEHTYRLHLHLDVLVQEKGPPLFVLRCPDLAVVRHEAVSHLAAMLQRELDDRYSGDEGFLVSLGCVSLATEKAYVEFDAESNVKTSGPAWMPALNPPAAGVAESPASEG